MSRVFQRKGSYWIDYKDAQGVRHRKKVAPDKRVAKEILADIESKVARRVHLGIFEESKISFADFTKTWKERMSPTLSPRTVERWNGIIDNHLIPFFSGALRSMTIAQVETYRTKRLEDGVTPSTVNREVMLLKHIINKAIKWEYLTITPIKDIKAFKEPSGRTRWLSQEEIETLLAACTLDSFPADSNHANRSYSKLLKHYLKPFMIIALNTGMRRGEILSITRKNIDWKNRLVTLEHTKNGEKRHVYLNQAALMAFKQLPPRLDAETLFPFTEDQIGMAVRRAINRAGIKDFRLHDMRHTFASFQAMNGIQGRGLQVLLGHKDQRMTMRYSHLSDEYLREAVNSVVLGLPKTKENGQAC
jgi:integrase